MMKISPRTALLAGAVSLVTTAASATTYSYQKISVPNAIQTDPIAINDSGTATGEWYDSKYGIHGWVFSGGKLTTFDVPKATNTFVEGMNSKGDIVGTYEDSNYAAHGFVRNARGKFTTIDVPGSTSSGVNGINDRGLMVVSGQDADGYQAIFTYEKGMFTTIVDNHQTPIATGINNKGAVVGFNEPPHAYETAFLYENGTVISLPITQYTFSAAFGINKHDEVVGQAANGATQYGFIYNAKGKVKYIGPNGSTQSFNLGINDAGVIVGVSYTTETESVGYVYDKGVFTTLSVTGGSNASANAINNGGLVLGNYLDSNNVFQTFLATPNN
jgi:probable HAF family extracellular repeat protein